MRIIHVLRKPCSESTVAANTLKHGTGGLNIDASRIAHGSDVSLDAVQRQQSAGGGSVGNHFGAGSLVGSEIPTYKPGGRWPANVILQHLDGCRCDGVKRVKPSNGSGTAVRHRGVKDINLYGGGIGSLPVGTPDLGYTDKDGKESVANWICEPGCPVARLDEQSGVIKGVVRQPTGKAVYPTEGAAMNWNSNSVIDNTVRGFGDTGGASRFFKQVGGGKVSE